MPADDPLLGPPERPTVSPHRASIVPVGDSLVVDVFVVSLRHFTSTVGPSTSVYD